MAGAQLKGTPLQCASFFLSRAIYHIEVKSHNFESEARSDMGSAEGALADAARQYPGNRTIRACGRIVRRLRQLRLCRSSVMLLDDVNVILIEITQKLEG